MPTTTGGAGLYDLRITLRWEVVEVVYFDDKQAVFMAKTIGDHVPAHHVVGGQPRTVKFKALNAVAMKMTTEAAQGAASSSSGAAEKDLRGDRVARQLNFVQKTTVKAKTTAEPKAEPKKEPRPTEPTGMTPPPKKAKEGEGEL